MIRMIITDIDGTLIKEENPVFPSEILSQIQILQNHGIGFAAASGRQYENMRGLFAPVARDMYFIYEGGNVVREGLGKVLKEWVMPSSTCQKLFHLVERHPNAEILMGCQEFAYVSLKSESFRHLMEDVKECKIENIGDFRDVKFPVNKISVYCPDGVEEFRNYLSQSGWVNPAELKAVQSAGKWIDFSMGDKGDSVGFLLDHLGIPVEDAMFFGDNHNDVSALEIVGHPIVIQDANPEIKSRFPRHCETVMKELETLIATL